MKGEDFNGSHIVEAIAYFDDECCFFFVFEGLRNKKKKLGGKMVPTIQSL